MENSIKGRRIGGQSVLARSVCQGCTSPPPAPHSTPTQGGCETALSKFCKTGNCDKIILNFMKLKENFAKHEIKNFPKISQNY